MFIHQIVFFQICNILLVSIKITSKKQEKYFLKYFIRMHEKTFLILKCLYIKQKIK